MNEESIAMPFLEHLGAVVVKLPEKHTKQADFLATFGGCRILVEEKERINDLKDEDGISSQGVRLSVYPFSPENTISGKIGKASKQLRSSNENDIAFRLVWYTATGTHTVAKRDQIYATLYGIKQIVDLDNSNFGKCYFYRNSEFFRHKEVLDGAVVAHETERGFEAKLCINPLSSAARRLRLSPLAAAIMPGIDDPEVKESRGEAYIVDGNVDRKDELVMQQFLKEKYGLGQIMSMDVAHHHGDLVETE